MQAPSHLNRAVTGPGAVATFAEDNKRLKYAEISLTYMFVPIAVDAMGAVGEEGLTCLKELGARIRTVIIRVPDAEVQCCNPTRKCCLHSWNTALCIRS